MSTILFDVARKAGLGVCSTHGGNAPADWKSATKKRGWAREFLFDFTMYRDWRDFSQPEVILEHENVWHVDAFMRDFWKLMFGYAPLRVMIGYRRDAADGAYLKAIRQHASARGWRYPPGVEDLVLIGHYGMAPQAFHVVIRSADSEEWSPFENLADFLKSR